MVINRQRLKNFMVFQFLRIPPHHQIYHHSSSAVTGFLMNEPCIQEAGTTQSVIELRVGRSTVCISIRDREEKYLSSPKHSDRP